MNVDKTAKTVTFVSQEDLGSGDAVIDKNALNNMITAAKAYTKESASDENECIPGSDQNSRRCI